MSDLMFNCSHSWFTAEGMAHQMPVMYRGRSIPRDCIDNSQLKHLFVVEVRYDTSDSTGLPTREQYDELAHFEKCFDAVENAHLGIIAFVRTFNGIVRYFLYVCNVELAAEKVNNSSESNIDMEFASADDPEWNEYQAFLRGARSDDSTPI